MNAIAIDPAELKSLIKSAFSEVLQEQRGVVHEMVEEELEDMADLSTLDERADEPSVPFDEVLKNLKRDGCLPD